MYRRIPKACQVNVVRYITKGNNDELLISTNNGFAILSQENWNEQRQNLQIIYHDSTNPYSICSNFLAPIFKDRNEVFWIGSIDSGLE